MPHFRNHQTNKTLFIYNVLYSVIVFQEQLFLDFILLQSQSASNVSLPVTPSVSQTRMDQLESSENATQRLQAAFLHYCKLNLVNI